MHNSLVLDVSMIYVMAMDFYKLLVHKKKTRPIRIIIAGMDQFLES